MLSAVLVAVSLLSARGVDGKDYKINSASDLVVFSNLVISGQKFTGTTVLLESDIVFTDELSKQFRPIGNTKECFQKVTFDGQGHIISGLVMESGYYDDLGLFSVARGITIRNVVIDDSCSITSRYGSLTSHTVGGIIGYCLGIEAPCIFENNVNMAPVTFAGYNHLYVADVFLGGLAGKVVSYSLASIKNCANYGDVSHPGVSDIAYIGGLVGEAFEYNYETTSVLIKNSINYGTVSYIKPSVGDGWVRLGGFVGYTRNVDFENCVCLGVVATNATNTGIGSFVGYMELGSTTNCYWNANRTYNPVGRPTDPTLKECSQFDEKTLTLDTAVTAGSYKGNSLLSVLNAYVDYNSKLSYSHWATNKAGNDVKFILNGGKGFTMKYRLMLLPNLAKGAKKAFSGWYTDSACKTLLSNYELTAATSLYGTFK